MAEHTPGPWQVSVPYMVGTDRERRTFTIVALLPRPGVHVNPLFAHREVLIGHLCTSVAGYGEPEELQGANAEFIVRACNSHYGLLAAAQFTLSVMLANHDDIELSEQMAIAKLEAAITEAKGGAA